MSEEIDRWVAFMKAHPDTWKQHHTAFINAQFKKQQAFLQRLKEQPGGREKIIALYDIKNIDGYPTVLQKSEPARI